jgi:hypothetical protein
MPKNVPSIPIVVSNAGAYSEKFLALFLYIDINENAKIPIIKYINKSVSFIGSIVDSHLKIEFVMIVSDIY